MKNKKIFIALLVGFVLCLTGASLGYYESKNMEKKPEVKKGEVTYIYYLENEKKTKEEIVNPVPVETEGEEVSTQVKYAFSRFQCTNNLTGYFDTTAWEFVPSEQKEAVCSLYFVNADYTVTFTLTNGEASEENPTAIKREENGVFTLIPSEGYEFDTYTCSNNKEGTWDATKNQFTINAIMEDIACRVVFKIRELEADIVVKNGTGTTTEGAEYGEKVTSIVTPNVGYEKPVIKCTNGQTATFNSNTITIAKLTDNTTCTVTFKQAEVASYTLKLTLSEHIKLINGEATQTIISGENGTFTLKADDGFEIDQLNCGGITPVATDLETGGIKYTFNGVVKNITCTVTEKESN